jgi:ACS family pantothenate transporter-like MFS transporter
MSDPKQNHSEDIKEVVSVSVSSRDNIDDTISKDSPRDYSITSLKEEEKKISIWRKIFPAPPPKSPREKKFLYKLDFWLLLWTSLAYFMKSIDQSNISNAYVSGMKEELNFQGRQYNLLDTFFKTGYALFLVPSQVMINKVKPNYWLGFSETIWGILTCLCAIAKKPEDLYPIRFFIGAFESSSWPGIIVLLMNYYTKEELAFRIGVFQASYYGGNMFAGFLQASIHKTLDGKLGRSGWRWMFIINGVMTIVVALCLPLALPDTPENGGSKVWMNEEDKKISIERMQKVGRNTKRGITFKDFWSVLIDWRLWLFLAAYCFKAYCSAFNYFNLFLKSLVNSDGTKTWSIEQLNLIPIGGNAISFCAVIGWAKLADLTQKPLYVIIFLLFTDFFAVIVLSIWPSSLGLKYAAFFMIPISDAVTSLLISLLAEVYSFSPGKRSIVTGIAVVLVYANNAWLPLLLWPANEAPQFKYGYKFSIGFITISFLSSIGYYHLVYKPSIARNLAEAKVRDQEEALNADELNEDLSEVKSFEQRAEFASRAVHEAKEIR